MPIEYNKQLALYVKHKKTVEYEQADCPGASRFQEEHAEGALSLCLIYSGLGTKEAKAPEITMGADKMPKESALSGHRTRKGQPSTQKTL